MKSKKICSVFLIIVILFVNFNVSFADEYKISKRFQESYEVLSALGFLHSDYTEKYIAQKQDEPVTRAYFAKFIHNVFDNNVNYTGKAYFYDVPATHYAFNAISSLTEKGVISLSDNRLFEPERIITRTEAAKLLLTSVGYGDISEYTGGWEKGINSIATKVKLFDGVSSKNEVTFSDMLIMTYNILFTEVLEITGVTGEGVSLEASGNTYLSRYYDTYKERGIVTGFDGISIYGDYVEENTAVIGGRVVKTDGIDLADYIGCHVEYIYRYDDQREESTLLWIKKTNKSDELYLNKVENSVSYDEKSNKISYHSNNGNTKKFITLSSRISVIVNGCFVEKEISSVLKNDYYSIHLIASEGNEYDVAVVEIYENYEVVTNDTKNEELYLKSCDNSNGDTTYKVVKLNDYDIVRITDSEGKIIPQSNVLQGKIVSVFDTPDKERLKISVSDSTIRGKISLISSDDGVVILKVDDVYHKMYKKDIIVDYSSINSYVELKLDAFGYVAMIKTSLNEINFGYLIRAIQDEGLKYDKRLVFKLFTGDGELLKLNASESMIMIDGVKYKDSSLAYKAIGGEYMQSQIVAYSLDSNGEIKMIDFADEYGSSEPKENDKLQMIQEKQSLLYNNWTNNLGPSARISSNTVVFGVPSNTKDARESEYSIGSSSNFSHDTSYTTAIYNYGDELNEYADVVACFDTVMGGSEWLSNRFVVDKLIKVVNSEGEIVTQAEGYHGNIKKTINFTAKGSEAAKGLHRGDILQVDTRIAEDIDTFTVNYSPRDLENIPLDRSFKTGGKRITIFKPHKIVGKTIQVGFESGEKVEEVFSAGNALILVYDIEQDLLYEGSLADLHTYVTHGDDCSDLFVYFNYGEVRNFVIYN